MLDLYGDVVSDFRKSTMQFLNNRQRVRGTVQEIWITEDDMLRSGGNLLRDVRQYNLLLHDPKCALIYRHHGTMAAEMLASTAGFRVPRDAMLSASQMQFRVATWLR